jgi:WD40 repeat protein
MNVNFIKNITCSAVLLSTVASITWFASVTFSNVSSGFALNTTNAWLWVNNPAKINGWGQQSIVKSYGNNASSLWLEGYASNAVVGNASLSGVTKPTRTNLVDANSNAVCSLAIPLRTTSNLLLYTARTYSSSLFVLRSRADSANITMRTTSNAINSLYQNLVVPTTDSIDGTVFARYHTTHHVFHNNGNAWTIRGWVRFNDGFTVMPRASVIMDTLVTVSGGMDLRDTGTLILNNDLYLAHNVTLTNGGNIKGQASSIGQANTIFMGGDLTLAEDSFARTLHITGDWSNSGTSGNLIIDGCGHTLNIGNRAQIFVDQNITLTLRNMTIKTGPKSLNNPAIQLASFGSKLALDNVMFDLGADFHFITGQIFVHNEVAVTGTSAFVYQSPVPSYITSGATWSFEQGTTFSVAPSTFTDCPFTVNNTYTNNAFLVLADASSALSLNGCSFQTTFTGLRLSKGMMLFDNKVAIDTTAGVDLATTGTTPIGYLGGAATGTYPISVAWSPDGRFLAVTNSGASKTVQVYRFNGSSAPTSLGTAATGTAPSLVSWSPNGRFLAVANRTSTTVQVYRFNGSDAPTSLGTAATGSQPYSVSWSPDGRFLAVANSSSTTVQVYRFNGSGNPISLGTAATGSQPYSVSWSPDGRFFAVVNYGSSTVQVYRFNGSGDPIPLGTAATGTSPYSVSWSPDGRFLAVANYGKHTVQVFRCNYYYTGQPSATQGFSNGLLLGDKAKGVSFDANVQVLSSASVKVKGMVKDDSV